MKNSSLVLIVVVGIILSACAPKVQDPKPNENVKSLIQDTNTSTQKSSSPNIGNFLDVMITILGSALK